MCKLYPLSEAARAAFEETSLAAAVSRFYWPARSREGAGSTVRDGPEESNCWRNAASWDARRAAPRESGGRSPRRILGTFLR